MGDKIVNYYEKLNIKGASLPKTWKRHHMFNRCHTLCLGGTGSGKTNSLINYISRSSGEFHKILICSFSTTDEPLYNMLNDTKNVELINDIDEVPTLDEFDDKNKDKPKLNCCGKCHLKKELAKAADETPNNSEKKNNFKFETELLFFEKIATIDFKFKYYFDKFILLDNYNNLYCHSTNYYILRPPILI